MRSRNPKPFPTTFPTHSLMLCPFYTAGRQRFICHCPDAQFPPVLRAPHQKLTVGDDSSCGWYAMKDKHDCLQAYNIRMARSPYGMNARLLEVDLWGTVIEGERGYRGEYQRILSVQPAGKPEMTITHRNQLYLVDTQILYRPVLRQAASPARRPTASRTWTISGSSGATAPGA